MRLRSSDANRPQLTYKSTFCIECGKLFLSEKLMTEHCKKIHGSKRHTCSVCAVGFKTQAILDDHVEMNHNNSPGPYDCGLCPLSFDKMKQLIKHKHNHMYINKIKSEINDEDSALTNGVPVNGESVQNEQPPAAPSPSTSSQGGKRPLETTNSATEEEEKIKNDDESSILECPQKKQKTAFIKCCTICSKLFTSKEVYYEHKLHHNGIELPKDKAMVSVSTQTASKAKWYCFECNVEFETPIDQIVHTWSHIKKGGKFNCESCHKLYDQAEKCNDLLQKHLAASHACKAKASACSSPEKTASTSGATQLPSTSNETHPSSSKAATAAPLTRRATASAALAAAAIASPSTSSRVTRSAVAKTMNQTPAEAAAAAILRQQLLASNSAPSTSNATPSTSNSTAAPSTSSNSKQPPPPSTPTKSNPSGKSFNAQDVISVDDEEDEDDKEGEIVDDDDIAIEEDHVEGSNTRIILIYKCSFNDFHARCRAKMDAHMAVHRARNEQATVRVLNKCDRCKKAFPKKCTLMLHKLKDHEHKEPLKCQFCNRPFASGKMLAKHHSAHIALNTRNSIGPGSALNPIMIDNSAISPSGFKQESHFSANNIPQSNMRQGMFSNASMKGATPVRTQPQARPSQSTPATAHALPAYSAVRTNPPGVPSHHAAPNQATGSQMQQQQQVRSSIPTPVLHSQLQRPTIPQGNQRVGGPHPFMGVPSQVVGSRPNMPQMGVGQPRPLVTLQLQSQPTIQQSPQIVVQSQPMIPVQPVITQQRQIVNAQVSQQNQQYRIVTTSQQAVIVNAPVQPQPPMLMLNIPPQQQQPQPMQQSNGMRLIFPGHQPNAPQPQLVSRTNPLTGQIVSSVPINQNQMYQQQQQQHRPQMMPQQQQHHQNIQARMTVAQSVQQQQIQQQQINPQMRKIQPQVNNMAHVAHPQQQQQQQQVSPRMPMMQQQQQRHPYQQYPQNQQQMSQNAHAQQMSQQHYQQQRQQMQQQQNVQHRSQPVAQANNPVYMANQQQPNPQRQGPSHHQHHQQAQHQQVQQQQQQQPHQQHPQQHYQQNHNQQPVNRPPPQYGAQAQQRIKEEVID